MLSGAKASAERNPDPALHSADPRRSACQQRDKTTWMALNVVCKTAHSKMQIRLSSRITLVGPFWWEGGRRKDTMQMCTWLSEQGQGQTHPVNLGPSVWRAADNHQYFHSKPLNHFIWKNKLVCVTSVIHSLSSRVTLLRGRNCSLSAIGLWASNLPGEITVPPALRGDSSNFQSPCGRFL